MRTGRFTSGKSKIIVLFFSICISLLIAEIALRMAGQEPMRVNENNFKLLKRNKKNSLNFSSGSVMIDDNEFDDKFIIQTNNSEKLKKMFDFNTKFKLDQVYALGFNGIISLDGNHLQYVERDLFANDESLMRLELVMHELCDLAEVMRYN